MINQKPICKKCKTNRFIILQKFLNEWYYYCLKCGNIVK